MTGTMLRLLFAVAVLTCKTVIGQGQNYISTTSLAFQCLNKTVNEFQVLEMLAKRKPTDDNTVRPVLNTLTPVKVGIRIVLSQINEINEKQGTATLSFYLSIKWQDEFFVYNQTMPYACIKAVHLPVDQLWLPDLALTNSADRYEVLLSDSTGRMRLYSNGTMLYRPSGTFITFCHFDLTFFPLDTQICGVNFESWRYTINEQQFYFFEPVFSTKYWIENEQWELVNQTFSHRPIEYPGDGHYDRVDFRFTLRRKIGYYLMNVIVPSGVISVAQVSVFSLPVDEVIKVHVSFTCLLAYGVFQLMIVEDMPRSSDSVPLLTLYITISMALILLAILGEACVFACLKKVDEKHKIVENPVPRRLLNFAKLFAIFCFVNESNFVQSSSNGKVMPVAAAKKMDDFAVKRLAWRFVATVIDRLTFMLYSLCTFVTPVVLFFVVKIMNN